MSGATTESGAGTGLGRAESAITGLGRGEREAMTPPFSFRNLRPGGSSLAGLAATSARSPELITSSDAGGELSLSKKDAQRAGARERRHGQRARMTAGGSERARGGELGSGRGGAGRGRSREIKVAAAAYLPGDERGRESSLQYWNQEVYSQ
jgi:hypothetical protein